MAITQEDKEFAAYVVDLMQGFGPVRSKSMFGGFGIFLDDLMMGLITDNELYLKVDEANLQQFSELGLMPFVYNKQGKKMEMSYYQAPEEAMEDSEIMAQWASSAYAAALRAAAGKKKKKV
jgi:DNA transformation protein